MFNLCSGRFADNIGLHKSSLKRDRSSHIMFGTKLCTYLTEFVFKQLMVRMCLLVFKY